jgi:hypothetical protein
MIDVDKKCLHCGNKIDQNYLIGQLFEIRKAMGVMEKPMLSDLAGIIASRWFKPIKDAPKDGTPVYLYVEGDGLVQAYWDKNDVFPNGFWRHTSSGKQCGKYSKWFILCDELTP